MRCCPRSPRPSARRWATARSSSRCTGRPGTTSASRPSTAPTRAARRCSAASARGRVGAALRPALRAPRLLPAALGRVRLVLGHESVSFVPDIEMADGPDAWHPEDALFVPAAPQRGAHARRSCPSTSRSPGGARPTTTSRCSPRWPPTPPRRVQDALAAAEAARHRTALEHLLRVSARLTETLSIDAILQEVCEGIRAALGFQQRLGRAHRRRPRSAPCRGRSSAGPPRRSPARRAATSRPCGACSTASSRSRAASCCPATRRARAWASSAPPTSRRATAAARSPGTTTG